MRQRVGRLSKGDWSNNRYLRLWSMIYVVSSAMCLLTIALSEAVPILRAANQLLHVRCSPYARSLYCLRHGIPIHSYRRLVDR